MNKIFPYLLLLVDSSLLGLVITLNKLKLGLSDEDLKILFKTKSGWIAWLIFTFVIYQLVLCVFGLI